MRRIRARVLIVCLLVVAPIEPGAALAISGTAPPAPVSAQDRLRDVILTAITDDGSAIVLASLALPHARFEILFRGNAPQWRFRILPLHHTLRATSVALAADGSKAIVTTDDGKIHLVDLAQRVLEIPQASSWAPERYTREWMPFVGPDGSTELINDAPTMSRGMVAANSPECGTGITALARVTSNDVWVIGANGALCTGTISPAGILRLDRQRQLNDANLTLVHRATDVRIVSAGRPHYTLIDPDSDARVQLSNVDKATEATLLAAGRFENEPGDGHRGAVKRLARELDAQAADAVKHRHAGLRTLRPWSAWTLTANLALYAPALEFGQNEPVRPTSIDVWKAIDAELRRRIPDPGELDPKERANESFAAYQRSVFAGSQCSIYTEMKSYPGSWLFQYWIYYPFDVGQGSHYHDTEHVFVEVDKLGGMVHQVIGAAHGVWAPNNIYRATSPNIPAPTLPIYAIAELGKHASAPDINRDLKFTVGVDVNSFRDKAKVWGVRDTTAFTDAHLRGYDGTMVLDRRPQDVWYPEAFDTFFPAGRNDASSPSDRVCKLLPFPLPPEQRCTEPSVDCAAGRLNRDGDHQKPTKALKRSYAPLHTLRYSYGRRPQVGGDGRLGRQWLHSLGGVGELSWMKFIPEPIRAPGRVAIDFYFPHDVFTGPVKFEGYQIRYERLNTNLTGLYLGGSFMKDPPRDARNDEWFGGHYRSWLDVGAFFEYAPTTYINVGVQTGLSYTNGAGVGWDLRFVGALLQQGKFGIKKKTKSPH